MVPAPNLKKLRFDTLQTFVTLCQTGSFSRTAEILGRSQGGVSQLISTLENEVFGCKLVKRSSRTFDLTAQGVIVRGFAETILRQFRNTMNALNSLAEELTGEIRVTASTTPGEFLLPPAISKFREEYPRVAIESVFNNSQKSADLLANQRADFALVGTKQLGNVDTTVFEIERIHEDELVIVCAKDHPLVTGARGRDQLPSLDDVLEYGFILRELGSGTRREFEAALQQLNKVPPRPVLELESNHAITNAVRTSTNLSVISKLVAREADVTILKIKDFPGLPRPLFLMNHKDDSAKIKRVFWEFLVEFFQSTHT